MFNFFPYGNGSVFTFTSFTSFSSSGWNGYNTCNGVNYTYGTYGNTGFDNYLKGGSNNFNNQYNQYGIEGILDELIKNVDVDKIAQKYTEALSQINNNLESKQEKECDFVELKQFDDMYVLKINLTGINLRELSINYNPGVIEVKAKKSEPENYMEFGGYMGKRMVKHEYNKKFENIEEIDLSRVIKNIDSGYFTINMPKRYVVDNSSNVIEINDYTVDNIATESPEKQEQ